MSTTTTITKPAPIIEGSLTAFLKSLDKLGAGAVPTGFSGIDTSKYDPKVAAQDALQKQAAQAAAGLGALTGPDAYKPFMSPYQQEVIDTTLAEFDRNQTIQDIGMRDQAIAAGAYGGGREGVMAAESARNAAASRAQLQAQLLNQGFQQAQQAAAADLASTTRFRWLSKSTRSTATSFCTSSTRCSTNRSKRKRIPTVHTIRIDRSTTCTNSTRCIPYTNCRYCSSISIV
jgi:hypothetical protein